MVKPHSIPHQVYLEYGGEYKCGGSLISDKFVLTAAHCIETESHKDLVIVVGDHNRTDPNDGQQKIGASNVLIHPGYNPFPKNKFDLAIIELKEPVSLRSEVGIVCLPNDTANTFIGSDLISSGWGRTEEDSSVFSDVLKAMHAKGISNEECQKHALDVFGRLLYIGEDEICALSSEASSIGFGDSGGKIYFYKLNLKQNVLQ